MADIVILRPQRPGEKSFLTCDCEQGDTMAVLVLHDAQGAFICALVCPSCDSEVPISFGRPE